MDGRQTDVERKRLWMSAVYATLHYFWYFFKKILLKKIDIRSYVRNTIVWEEIAKITLQEEKMGAERKR